MADHGFFNMEECPAEEEEEEAPFAWDEVAAATQDFSSSTQGLEGHSADDHGRVAAQLQRTLQAIDDVADRELIGIHKRQLSPITCYGRELWGDRPKYHASGSDGDPLASTARKMRALTASRPPLRSHRARKEHSRPAAPHQCNSGKASTTWTAWRSIDLHREEATRTVSDGPLDGAVSVSCLSPSIESLSPPPGWANSTLGCSSERESPSHRALMARSPEPRWRHTTSCVETSASTVGRGPAIVGGASAQAEPISDPAALLQMYKRMLFQETNNGLMGGTPFISEHGGLERPTTVDSTTCHSRHSVGQWKGVSRGTMGLNPLITRS